MPIRELHDRWVTKYTENRAGGLSELKRELEHSCRLTITHDQLRDDAPSELYGGWPMVLSGLKTWLETGEPLTTPGSLMYDDHT